MITKTFDPRRYRSNQLELRDSDSDSEVEATVPAAKTIAPGEVGVSPVHPINSALHTETGSTTSFVCDSFGDVEECPECEELHLVGLLHKVGVSLSQNNGVPSLLPDHNSSIEHTAPLATDRWIDCSGILPFAHSDSGFVENETHESRASEGDALSTVGTTPKSQPDVEVPSSQCCGGAELLHSKATDKAIDCRHCPAESCNEGREALQLNATHVIHQETDESDRTRHSIFHRLYADGKRQYKQRLEDARRSDERSVLKQLLSTSSNLTFKPKINDSPYVEVKPTYRFRTTDCRNPLWLAQQLKAKNLGNKCASASRPVSPHRLAMLAKPKRPAQQQ